MYQLFYDKLTGKPLSIQNGNMSIPICEGNIDYQDFLKWNSEQEVPLDLNSTIPVIPPEPAMDVIKEINDLKAQVAIAQSQLSDVQANVNIIAAATNTDISVKPTPVNPKIPGN